MTHDPHRPEEESPNYKPRIFRDDTQFALGRITAFQYVAVGVFLFLIAGYWILQVRDHDANSELAERNRIKTVPVPAPRGKILDRDGLIIVDNQPSYALRLMQENLKPEHLPGIAQGLNMDLGELQALVAQAANGPKYRPIPIKQDLTPAEYTFVESHRDPDTFPELDVIQIPRRLYPKDGVAAHVVGYVGQVSEEQLNTAEFAQLSQNDKIGQQGLERQYNELLTGVDGERRVVVDVHQRERQVLDNKEAIPGKNLQLTLDMDLQAVAEDALDGRRGAVVALDPRTGEVLAMVSRPSFDPNVFAGRLRQKDWDEINNNPYKPMLNRAIQGTYPPGSTFKPLVAMAGLETGIIDPHSTTICNGGGTYYDNYFHCHMVHGSVDLHRGIVASCDVYFYTAGAKIGIDNIAKYAQIAGIGEKTGIDLPGEEKGLMPSTKWKIQNRDRWYLGETISVSIGQGAVSVTPLQLATAIGGMATGGVWYQPHLVKEASSREPVRKADWTPENIQTVVSGMYGVVNEEGGTGKSARLVGISIAGKTGSAQRISNALAKSNKELAKNYQDNGVFVGFAPADHPEIVVVTMIEAGIHGGLDAAPISASVIKAYFDKKTRSANDKPLNMAMLLKPGLKSFGHYRE